MIGRQVVAIGDDQEARQPVESARREAEEVEGGLVRPVDVLEHDDRSCGRGHLGHERVRHRDRIPRRERPVEWAGPSAHHVSHGPEGSRSEEVVAAADQHATFGMPSEERVDDARFSCPGFTGDERETAAFVDAAEQVFERFELRSSFEQRHGAASIRKGVRCLNIAVLGGAATA